MSIVTLNTAGATLVAAAVGWTLLTGSASGGSPGPVVALLVASAAALVIGCLAGGLARWLVPAAVVVCAGVLALSSRGALGPSPVSGPFGYSNAAGSFFVQAAVAGLMLAVAVRATPAKALGVAAALVFAATPFIIGSLAAAALVAVLPIVVVLARGTRAVRLAIAGCAALFLAALAASMILGATYSGGPRTGTLERLIDRTLSERRPALWHDALEIMADHPRVGVGPGRFRFVSPTALGDRDARWAHNGFLQQGAEQGIIGFVLLLLLFLWGFARLWASSEPDLVTALGAVALAALGIHACLDYVLHFPAVPIAAAALVGAAQASSHRIAIRTENDELELTGT